MNRYVGMREVLGDSRCRACLHPSAQTSLLLAMPRGPCVVYGEVVGRPSSLFIFFRAQTSENVEIGTRSQATSHSKGKGRVHSYVLHVFVTKTISSLMGTRMSQKEGHLTVRVRYEVIPLDCIPRGLVDEFEALIIELSCGTAGYDDEIRRVQ